MCIQQLRANTRIFIKPLWPSSYTSCPPHPYRSSLQCSYLSIHAYCSILMEMLLLCQDEESHFFPSAFFCVFVCLYYLFRLCSVYCGCVRFFFLPAFVIVVAIAKKYRTECPYAFIVFEIVQSARSSLPQFPAVF